MLGNTKVFLSILLKDWQIRPRGCRKVAKLQITNNLRWVVFVYCYGIV